ncbi:MAG TPA: hypothetical protein PKI68_08075, partial [Pontiellaceae bacterium]|nr:hypothetical protein [Pontiellaceae bacterium]
CASAAALRLKSPVHADTEDKAGRVSFSSKTRSALGSDIVKTVDMEDLLPNRRMYQSGFSPRITRINTN